MMNDSVGSQKKVRGQAVILRHELLMGRLYWGRLPNGRWAERHGIDFLDTLVFMDRHRAETTTLYFVAATTKSEHAECRFAVIPMTSPSTADELPDEVIQWAHPETQLFSLERSQLIPLRRTECGSVETDTAQSMVWQGRRSPFDAACKATVELRSLFSHWMAAFRGVAIKYLKHYIAWFEAALEKGDVAVPVGFNQTVPYIRMKA